MDKKKVVSAIVIGLVGVGLGGIAGSQMFPVQVEKQIFVDKIVTVEKPIVTEKVVEVIKEVPVEKVVEKIVEVPALCKEVAGSTDALSRAMEFIQDNIDEDVTEDYIQFEVDARIESEAWLNNNLVKELYSDDYFESGELLEGYRKSEVAVSKIYDPELSNKDYDEKNVELTYVVKIKAKKENSDREYFTFEVVMPFEKTALQTDDIEIVVQE